MIHHVNTKCQPLSFSFQKENKVLLSICLRTVQAPCTFIRNSLGKSSCDTGQVETRDESCTELRNCQSGYPIIGLTSSSEYNPIMRGESVQMKEQIAFTRSFQLARIIKN